jgi:hypothetical protein
MTREKLWLDVFLRALTGSAVSDMATAEKDVENAMNVADAAVRQVFARTKNGEPIAPQD